MSQRLNYKPRRRDAAKSKVIETAPVSLTGAVGFSNLMESAFWLALETGSLSVSWLSLVFSSALVSGMESV